MKTKHTEGEKFMKLELNHLAPYLPYVLMLNQHREDLNINTQSELVSLSADKMRVLLKRFPYSEDVCYYEVKPILRPLSDLTKEIEHNGKRFMPEHELVSMQDSVSDAEWLEHCHDRDWKDCNWHLAPYHMVEKLFEWHFDVFGLIEKGLAIDKATKLYGNKRRIKGY